MNDIPIFDSLMHPMPNGNWISSKFNGGNYICAQLQSMRENGISWALAVGVADKALDYEEETYANFIKSHADYIFPVAFCDFRKLTQGADIESYLARLKNIGYVAIKIHPRISSVTYSHPLMVEIIVTANRLGLGVLLCTYFWDRCGAYGARGIEGLMGLMTRVVEQRLILLHSGGVRLLEMAEIARQFPNVLLDLSFTLCKYEGSSLDLDIKYLFDTFDRRICIGSDSPEFGHRDLRRRFKMFSIGLDVEKSENIAYRNLFRHLGI